MELNPSNCIETFGADVVRQMLTITNSYCIGCRFGKKICLENLNIYIKTAKLRDKDLNPLKEKPNIDKLLKNKYL